MAEKKLVTLMLHQNFVVFYILFIKFDEENIMTINVMSYCRLCQLHTRALSIVSKNDTGDQNLLFTTVQIKISDYFKPFSLD
jgi:hypothetical protein